MYVYSYYFKMAIWTLDITDMRAYSVTRLLILTIR
jgi:hypothetical protein